MRSVIQALGIVAVITMQLTTDALAQRRAIMPPSNTVRVTVSFESDTGFGLAEGSDVGNSLNTGGQAVVTGFPNSDHFVAAAVHRFDLESQGTFWIIPVIFGSTDYRVGVSNIRVNAVERSDAFIEGFDNATLEYSPVSLSGTIRFREDSFFGFDVTEDFVAVVSPVDVEIDQDGVMIFGINQPLIATGQFDAFELPYDVFTLSYTVQVDSIRYTGDWFDAFGDDDADGDVDLRDFSRFQLCTDEEIKEPFCYIFDFDVDEDVDLLDWGGMQAGFDPNP